MTSGLSFTVSKYIYSNYIYCVPLNINTQIGIYMSVGCSDSFHFSFWMVSHHLPSCFLLQEMNLHELSQLNFQRGEEIQRKDWDQNTYFCYQLRFRCSSLKGNDQGANAGKKERCFIQKSQLPGEKVNSCLKTSSHRPAQPRQFVKGKWRNNLGESLN